MMGIYWATDTKHHRRQIIETAAFFAKPINVYIQQIIPLLESFVSDRSPVESVPGVLKLTSRTHGIVTYETSDRQNLNINL